MCRVLGAVFDCVVFVQALANPRGPAGTCFELVRSGHVRLYISPSVRAEVAEVLGRPIIRRRLKGLTNETVAAYLDEIDRLAHSTPAVPPVIALERDPKDEKYINLAIAAQASYLVTRDQDLLDLMGPGRTPGSAFRDFYPFLTITDPVTLLRVVRIAAGKSTPGDLPPEDVG
jgi:putative PIN family toxin of toxin-antitoxin system